MALLPVKLPANIGTTLRQQQEQGLVAGVVTTTAAAFRLVFCASSRAVDMTFVGCALFTILDVIGLVECSSERSFRFRHRKKKIFS